MKKVIYLFHANFTGGITLNTAVANRILNETCADALIISSPENIYYFSGFSSGDATLIIMPERQIIFTDSRYFIQAAQQAPEFDIIDIQVMRPAKFLSGAGLKKAGFEDDFISYSQYLKLSEAAIASGCELFGISRGISTERRVKNDYEMSCIKTAAQIADGAFSFILDKIHAGVTETDIALMLDFYMRKNGADGIAFPTICASGPRSAMPHGAPTDRILEKGDFVVLDYGCKYKGYVSDMTRTVVIGAASADQKKIYNTVLIAQKAALEAIKPNAANSAIDKIARDIITEAGYGDNFAHALGHSVGLAVHEEPTLSPRSNDKLTSGVVITVEPGIYIENYGGVRIEDLIAITYNGYTNFTSSAKELLEL